MDYTGGLKRSHKKIVWLSLFSYVVHCKKIKPKLLIEVFLSLSVLSVEIVFNLSNNFLIFVKKKMSFSKYFIAIKLAIGIK